MSTFAYALTGARLQRKSFLTLHMAKIPTKDIQTRPQRAYVTHLSHIDFVAGTTLGEPGLQISRLPDQLRRAWSPLARGCLSCRFRGKRVALAHHSSHTTHLTPLITHHTHHSPHTTPLILLSKIFQPCVLIALYFSLLVFIVHLLSFAARR